MPWVNMALMSHDLDPFTICHKLSCFLRPV